ncbi:GntR family transcriptional regulator [Hamadaea flava]|uniref:GntR family transcriptional regulator n=1 Tax=Hamadaea flava TaxID=1742688 RepID=UPI0020A56CD0|nr:GntR family transcriptional regulator [Hamadaea flava]
MIEPSKSQYVQIAELLQRRIDDGTYPPGSVLPSEPDLANELNVSRVTVNKAVTLLRASGAVKVRRGAGTFVRSLPKIPRDAVARFAARGQGTGAGQVEITKLNLQSRTAYLHIGEVTAPPEVDRLLQLNGRPALVRSRVLFANEEPTQLADSYYPWALVKNSNLTEPDVGKGGSYGRLADLGHGPVRFTEDINVRMPTDDERRRLEIEPTLPVFEITHVAYAEGDQPVSVTIHVMPGHLWTLRYGWNDMAGEGAQG